MIEDLTLRWTVTALFAIAAAACAMAAYGVRRDWTTVIGSATHVLMAVAMAVMAWPQGAALPATPPMVLFLLAAGWYTVMLVTQTSRGHRLSNVYHVAMTLAMVWMYALMNGDLLPEEPSDSAPDTAHHRSHLPGLDHQGIDVPHSRDGTDVMTGMSDPVASYPVWIIAITWIGAIGFAIATAYWFYRYLTHSADSAEESPNRVGLLCQAMMAGGMATMFGLMI